MINYVYIIIQIYLPFNFRTPSLLLSATLSRQRDTKRTKIGKKIFLFFVKAYNKSHINSRKDFTYSKIYVIYQEQQEQERRQQQQPQGQQQGDGTQEQELHTASADANVTNNQASNFLSILN